MPPVITQSDIVRYLFSLNNTDFLALVAPIIDSLNTAVLNSKIAEATATVEAAQDYLSTLQSQGNI